MAAPNRIARRLLPLLVFLLARPQPFLLLGTTAAAADATADNGDKTGLVRVSAWVQKQLGGDPDDGLVRTTSEACYLSTTLSSCLLVVVLTRFFFI